MNDRSRDVAVLTGNGLSIAFNPDLLLKNVTRKVISRISAENGDNVAKVMKDISTRLLDEEVGLSDDDFEVLIGAFGLEHQTLQMLERLSTELNGRDQDLSHAFERVSHFVRDIRDQGLSHVLEVITEASGLDKGNKRKLCQLIDLICNEFKGNVTFGNLNYDALLLTVLLNFHKSDLADLGDGRGSVPSISEELPYLGWKLRKKMTDFPQDKRIRLMHLHGSICFWSDHDNNTGWKIERANLESGDIFRRMRDQSLDRHEPLVVLSSASEKQRDVKRYPFNLAYEGFGTALTNAPRWMIIGYSFRDTPVNDMLKNAFLSCETKPTVLVATYGNQPTRESIEKALGWGKEDGKSNSKILICRNGAFAISKSSEWNAFVS